MKLNDWAFLLENSAYDSAVGIKIAKLAGNEEFCTYLTSIDPGKSVNAHFHQEGEEHYHIIDGNGEIELIDVKTKVAVSHRVTKHCSFVVQPNISHQLKNNGNDQLILMFSCPPSHLDKDRFLMD